MDIISSRCKVDQDRLSDNWRLKSVIKPIDENNFDAYVERFGRERALGYLDAIADMKAEVDWMLFHTTPDSGGWRRTESKTAKLLRDFQKQKNQFVNSILNHTICKNDLVIVKKLKQK